MVGLCVFVIQCNDIFSGVVLLLLFFFFKQKTAYELRISDWSSDVCSSDLIVEFDPDLAIGAAGVGLVGDKTDRARHRTCAVKRALRSRERFDAREVIGVDIERALNRRDRHFVEIGADRRQRRRMIGVLARRDAAEINLAEPWRSEEHTSELQSLMRTSYAVFCLQKKTQNQQHITAETRLLKHT